MSVAMEAGNRDVGVLLYAHAERLKSAASVINNIRDQWRPSRGE